MSDLKKTLRDMEKTEVGEYRHGRGHFPTEDDGGRANVEVLQALCPNPGATALESVVWAADQIESLQQFRRDAKVENAELHAKIESLQRENEALQSLADAAGMDAERAITRADKAELDLKCLQESTVDAKAYQALQREKAETEAELFILGNENEAARKIAQDQRRRIEELERENEEARQYASNLVDALQQRLYPEVTGWTKLPDLLGILTQIDNMIAGIAAITPEMREKVAAAIQLYEILPPVPGPRGTEFAPTAYSIFRALLGEQR